jgi:hypothetical protein
MPLLYVLGISSALSGAVKKCGHVVPAPALPPTWKYTQACVTQTDYIRSTHLKYQRPAKDFPYYDRHQTVELPEYSNALSRNEGTGSVWQEICRTPSCVCSDRIRKTLWFCLRVSSRPGSAGISHTDASAKLQHLPGLNILGAPGSRPPSWWAAPGRSHAAPITSSRVNTLVPPSNCPLPSPRAWPLVVSETP